MKFKDLASIMEQFGINGKEGMVSQGINVLVWQTDFFSIMEFRISYGRCVIKFSVVKEPALRE